MQIAHFTTQLPPAPSGGIGHYVFHLNASLNDVRGIKSIAVAPKFDLATFFVDSGPSTPSFPDLWGYDIMAILHQNAQMAADFQVFDDDRPDVIHCHDYFAIPVASAIADRYNVPLVLTKHFVYSPRIIDLRDDQRQILRHYRRFVQNWSIERADYVVATSNFIRDEVIELIPSAESKMSVIYAGMERPPESIEPAAASQLSDRALDVDTPMLLISRIIEPKGGDIAVKALSMLSDTPVKLLFVGEGEYQPELERLTETLGVSDRVGWTGYLPPSDTWELRRTAQISLLPTRYDAYPLVVLEALSAGHLVIASDIAGVKEQIEHRKNGLLFQNGSPEGLAEQIRWALLHPHKVAQIRKRAIDRAMSAPGWPQVAEEYIRIYEHVVRLNSAR